MRKASKVKFQSALLHKECDNLISNQLNGNHTFSCKSELFYAIVNFYKIMLHQSNY